MKALLLVLMLVPGVVVAQAMHGFTFTIGDPVERVDGQEFDPETELQSYRLRCEGAENVERTVDRDETEDVGEGKRRYEWLGAVQRGGWYQCMATAIDTDGLESDWSEAEPVRKQAQPMPPGLDRIR